MLDAGTAPLHIAGVTIFSDHADPQLRYVVADAPRVPADPEPRLTLLLFRGPAEGALLQLDTVLGPTAAQLEAVTHALTPLGGPPRLARPDWRGGTVSLAGWLWADELRPLTLSLGTPSLVGDPSATIAARLDRAGAALAERALSGGDALPTVVLYTLEFLGLAGPLGVEAEADLQAIHERLTLEGAVHTPYGRARLAKTWEEFAKDDLIRLRVVDESGDVESRRAEALARVGSELVATLLSPGPPPEAPRMLDDQPVAQVELSFRLTMRREALATTARWSFLERAARRITHHAAASLIGILGDRPIASHVRYADLTPPSRELVVRAEPELAALGIAALEVDLRLGSAPDDDDAARDPTGALAVTLTPEHVEARIPVARDPTLPLHYRVRARFDPAMTRAPATQTAWMEALGSAVVISARRLFPPRSLTVVAGHLPLDWLAHVELVVQPPAVEEPPRSLLLSSATRSARADFAAAGAGPLTVTAHYRGREGEPSASDPPRALDPGQDLLVIDGPFGPTVDVLLVPVPLSGVVSIVVELVLEHEGWRDAKAAAWDRPDRAPQRVGLRRLRGMPDAYRHRTTVVRDDGRVDVIDWAESDRRTLVVGAEGPVRVDRTEVFVLGGGPAGRGSLAIELSLTAGDASTQVLLEGTHDAAELVLVSPAGGPAPALVVREILADGRTREERRPEPPALVVLPLPSPDAPS
jgi:hypothetical protein